MRQTLWEILNDKVGKDDIIRHISQSAKVISSSSLDKILNRPYTNSSELFSIGIKSVNKLLYNGKLPVKKELRNQELVGLYTSSKLNETQLNEDIRDVGLHIYQAIYDYRNKRRLIISGVIGIGLLSIVGSFFGLKYILKPEVYKNKDIEFEDAKENPSLRQKFIDDVIQIYPHLLKI